MAAKNRANSFLRGAVLLSTAALAACTSTIAYEDVRPGLFSGHVVVEWVQQDYFVYRQQRSRPFSFTPSFMRTAIVPEDMYTDGGSVPQVFWNIPGLSPWALGPAYIIHDWLFAVHRCNRPAPPEVRQINFEQSALILAEIAKGLAAEGLLRDNLIPQVVWAIQTRYARDLWDRPGTPEECREPAPLPLAQARARRSALPGGRTVLDFTFPPRSR
jgi:hypothetical protein